MLGFMAGSIAGRIPVRSLPALRAAHPGLDPEALSQVLIDIAAKRTAAVGVAAGGFGAIEWTVPPLLLALPAHLAAEATAIAAIEMKLIAELHEVLGQPIAGGSAARGLTTASAWTRHRGARSLSPETITRTVNGVAKRHMRRLLGRHIGRRLTSFGPFLSGAVIAGTLNRRETRLLGAAVREELRRQHLSAAAASRH
jgi:hypothetical protein